MSYVCIVIKYNVELLAEDGYHKKSTQSKEKRRIISALFFKLRSEENRAIVARTIKTKVITMTLDRSKETGHECECIYS